MERDAVLRDHRTVRYLSGPLLFVENLRRASYGEMVSILLLAAIVGALFMSGRAAGQRAGAGSEVRQ